MKCTCALLVSCASLVVAIPTAANGQLANTAEKKVCQAKIEELLLNKRLVAKVTFPARMEGIDVDLDGKVNTTTASYLSKKHGVGIEIDEPATVTFLRLKDNVLEIHLNGGGFGTVNDYYGTSKTQRQSRSIPGKTSGGSRINLRFSRPVTCDELTNAERVRDYLAPVADAEVLKQAAAVQAIPPKWAEAAAQKKIVVGMDKSTVFAILGEPKQKKVDLDVNPPVERWQYDLAAMRTRIITFTAGKVSKIDEI